MSLKIRKAPREQSLSVLRGGTVTELTIHLGRNKSLSSEASGTTPILHPCVMNQQRGKHHIHAPELFNLSSFNLVCCRLDEGKLPLGNGREYACFVAKELRLRLYHLRFLPFCLLPRLCFFAWPIFSTPPLGWRPRDFWAFRTLALSNFRSVRN